MSAYNKLGIGQKRTHATMKQREPSVACPRCDTRLMPTDLVVHMIERCAGSLGDVHPRSKWISRIEALRFAPSSRLDTWVASGLVRTRADGKFVERDVTLAVAWARALGAL